MNALDTPRVLASRLQPVAGLLAASTSHYRRPLLHTPFFEPSRPWIQNDTFVGWAGYCVPDVYSSTEQEYFAIRNTCSVFDLTPMIKYLITGPDAERYLDRVVTCDLRKLKVDRVVYTVWCDDEGKVIDDGTVFRFGPQEFRLCTAERQLDWLLDCATGFDVHVREVTPEIAALAVQGPTSFATLRAAGFQGLETLTAMGMSHHRWEGHEVMVSRTGFTGDLGYEVWVPPEGATLLWQRLMAAGQARGILPIGYRALDMARIEAGFILPEVDFVSAHRTVRLDRESSPFELSLDWTVALGKGHFNGRRALVREKERGIRRRLVGLELDGNKPGHDSLVYADRANERQVGEITTALWSPTCKRNIALARIDAPWCDRKDVLWVDLYLQRELRWERRNVRAWIVDRPFFLPDRRRATPPVER
jgi:aminomethyltransferase